MQGQRRTAFVFFVVFAAFVAFADRPEITWSVMHPTAIDTNYMARVVEQAKAYGGVDSFEVCGDCHSAYGGINGLSMLDPYPKAHALVDVKSVRKARAELNEVVRLAHGVGARLYYWHREIFVPKGLLEDVPEMRDEDGEFDLLGEAYRRYLRFKIDETFKYVPGLDGIVLTLTEAEFSVIHNSNPKRYPPEEVVAQLVGLFAEEHEKRGKRFCLRSFGSTTKDYEILAGGAKRASAKHKFEIETKVTEADFVPFLPINPFLVRQPGLTLAAECDALGEFLGAGYLPAAQVGRIREYVEASRARGVGRYAIRIDRVGNSIFDSAHEVNLAAYMRFVRDPSATEDQVISDYAARHFGAAADEIKGVLVSELEMVRDVQYIASNLVFHSLPIQSDLRTTKAGAIFSLYCEGAPLKMAKNVWSIFDKRRAPSHETVLAEKRRGREMAERGLATVERLKDKLPADEYARQRRAFANAVKVARAQEAFATCCVAYFEDMAARRDEPTRLRSAVAEAERTIAAEMTDPNERFADAGYHFTVVGDNLDRAFLAGLRFHCAELLREYAAERTARRELEARGEVMDFVIPGGIYDDNRTGRSAMHAAYAKILDGRLVRWAGNPEHPNGTLTVEFRDVPDATVEVVLAPEGAAECMVTESVTNGLRTVVVGKKGVAYPAVRHIALVSKTSFGDAFRSPASELAPGFFWILNAPLEEGVLNGQLDEMAAAGICSVCPHPFPRDFRPTQCRSTMTPDYLSDGFLAAYVKSVGHARDLGFNVWLYDEGGWPSGNACGQVARSDAEGRFCVRYLHLSETGAPELFVEPYRFDRGASGCLPSVIEPGATDRFIALTHDRYRSVCWKDFGKTIRFAFTDEPTCPTSAPGRRLAWASDFDQEFRRRKGYEIRPFAPFLIAGTNTANEAETQARVDYEDVMSQLFVERYLDPIRNWCRAHGLKSGGHLNGEDAPENAVRYAHGSLLRSLRHLDVPGVDTIWRQLFPDYPGKPGRQAPFPRYAASAAHRNGGRHVLSESFAIYGDSLTPDQMKWVVDYQLVRGITQFVFGYYGVSNDGQWMNLFEPHAGPVQPYWAFQKPFFMYVHRLSALLAQGEPTTEIAVLFDTRDFWSGGEDCAAAAKAHYAVARALDRRNCEYDFTDDEEIAAATVHAGRLQIGKMSYSTIVLPYSKRLLSAAWEKLEAFRRAGGLVIGPDEIGTVPPTVVVRGEGADDIRVLKRCNGNETLWFFVNESAVVSRKVRLHLPRSAEGLVRADPETGDFTDIKREADGAVVWTFPPCGSLALIEGKTKAQGEGEQWKVSNSIVQPSTFNLQYWKARPLWRVRAGKTDFERENLSNGAFRDVQLGDWRTWLGNDFSGVVRYRTMYSAGRAEKVRIDLGRVAGASRLYVNGREIGTRFFGLHAFEVSVNAGEYVIDVDVANTLANAIAADEVRDCIAHDYPPLSRYDRHQRVFDREFNESGLYGPVKIEGIGSRE